MMRGHYTFTDEERPRYGVIAQLFRCYASDSSGLGTALATVATSAYIDIIPARRGCGFLFRYSMMTTATSRDFFITLVLRHAFPMAYTGSPSATRCATPTSGVDAHHVERAYHNTPMPRRAVIYEKAASISPASSLGDI